jgi:hypothetical protein
MEATLCRTETNVRRREISHVPSGKQQKSPPVPCKQHDQQPVVYPSTTDVDVRRTVVAAHHYSGSRQKCTYTPERDQLSRRKNFAHSRTVAIPVGRRGGSYVLAKMRHRSWPTDGRTSPPENAQLQIVRGWRNVALHGLLIAHFLFFFPACVAARRFSLGRIPTPDAPLIMAHGWQNGPTDNAQLQIVHFLAPNILATVNVAARSFAPSAGSVNLLPSSRTITASRCIPSLPAFPIVEKF